MSSASYSSKSMDHLGLISGFCKEIGLSEHIDSHFPNQSDFKHVTYGQCVEAMLLNGLGFVGRTLHMSPQYFETKPIYPSEMKLQPAMQIPTAESYH